LADRAKTLVTVVALAQFTGSTSTASTVREREIVEDQQLARSQGHVDLDVFDVEAVACEEREFGANAVELHPTKKIPINFDARKKW
jgi:hypothetical protein